jgi:hypothetical protein
VDVMARTKLINFSENAMEELDKLEKELGFKSTAEVLRAAMNLLSFTIERLNKGDQLVFSNVEEEKDFVLTKEQKEVVIKITSIEDVKKLPTSDN